MDHIVRYTEIYEIPSPFLPASSDLDPVPVPPLHHPDTLSQKPASTDHPDLDEEEDGWMGR